MEANSTLLHYGNDTSHIHTQNNTHTATTHSLVDMLHSGSSGLSQCSLIITFLWIFMYYYLLMLMRVSISLYFSFIDWNCFQNFFRSFDELSYPGNRLFTWKKAKKLMGENEPRSGILTFSNFNFSQLPLSFVFSSQN